MKPIQISSSKQLKLTAWMIRNLPRECLWIFANCFCMKMGLMMCKNEILTDHENGQIHRDSTTLTISRFLFLPMVVAGTNNCLGNQSGYERRRCRLHGKLLSIGVDQI